MCTLMALTLASAGISAAGSLMQGQHAQAAANAQAAALQQQAAAEQKASSFEAAQTFRQQDYQQASARAQVGASGVGFAGSPTEVLTANAAQGQLDLEAIRFGSTLRQNNLNTQAGISRMQGKQARTAGYISAAGNFISGISQLYDPSKAVRMGQNPFV